jgi:hypothetical protein
VHALRHTYVTIALRAGVHPAIVSELPIGGSSIDVIAAPEELAQRER